MAKKPTASQDQVEQLLDLMRDIRSMAELLGHEDNLLPWTEEGVRKTFTKQTPSQATMLIDALQVIQREMRKEMFNRLDD